ncbi:MAG TPA: hypothetical protein V6C71_06465 [Coleofasciculaceae cyanobacterium]|jgi:hypothetical protein
MNKDFCFCTLAISHRYCLLAKELAADLAKYAPEKMLIVYTDQPRQFESCSNVLAFKHYQKGVHSCMNDKRLVIEKALSIFNAAIFFDADSKIIAPIDNNMTIQPGITVHRIDNILKCKVNQRNKYRAEITQQIADKLNIDLKVTNLIPGNIFAISKEDGKEIEFFKTWDKIGRYFELKNLHYAEENSMGLAATKAGLTVRSGKNLEELKKIRQHLHITSHSMESKTILERLKRWRNIPYRLSLALIIALKDFKFYFNS